MVAEDTAHFGYSTEGIQLDLTRKPPPWGLALILIARCYTSCKKENQTAVLPSCDAYITQWLTGNIPSSAQWYYCIRGDRLKTHLMEGIRVWYWEPNQLPMYRKVIDSRERLTMVTFLNQNNSKCLLNI